MKDPCNPVPEARVVSRVLVPALLTLALLGALTIPIVPCVDRSRSSGALIAAAAYSIGAAVCHQRADRSFSSCGHQWPVCGRCSGLYLGAGLAVLLAAIGLRGRATWRQWRTRVTAAALPTAALWSLEALGVVDPGNAVRFGAALPLGLAAGLWLAAVARGDLT